MPRTEIKESGYNLEVLIEPSANNVISGIVTITATQVVKEAAGVGFYLSKTKEALTDGGMASLGIDRSLEGGWSNTFNTTELDNGKYYISVVVYSTNGDGPPLGAAQVPVVIKNFDESTNTLLAEPATISQSLLFGSKYAAKTTH